MSEKFSFRERMTGLKKCPVCGQRKIPLDEDFCDECSEKKQVEILQKNSLITNENKRLELYIERARSFQKLRAYEEPNEAIDESLKIDPKNVGALVIKGYNLILLNKNQEALSVLGKALKIDPKNVKALLNKGCALSQLRKHQEALDILDEALKIDPKDIAVLNCKGFVLNELGKHQEAAGVFDEALKIDPKAGDGRLYLNKGKAIISKSFDGSEKTKMRIRETAIVDPVGKLIGSLLIWSVAIFSIGAILVGVYYEFFGKEDEQIKCVHTSKKLQTIERYENGEVVGYDEVWIDGCVDQKGNFYPKPDIN